MLHYVAIVEDATPDTAAGLWFPDLPGCFAAGDDLDTAFRNAPEAIELYAQSLAKERRKLPLPRSLSAIKNDPTLADNLRDHVVALVSLPVPADAAE